MPSYTIRCKVEATVSFELAADSLEDALARGRDKASKLNPFAKGVSYDDGGLTVDGVFEHG